MGDVWWKPRVFTQVGFTLTFPPHILYSLPVHNVGTQGRWVPLGNSLAIIKQHKPRVFRGLSLFQPPIFISNYISSLFQLSLSQNLPCSLQIKVSQDDVLRGFKQWPKGLLGRGCLHKLFQEQIVYMFMCHTPVTLIKSTYLLSHGSHPKTILFSSKFFESGWDQFQILITAWTQ